MTLVWLLVAAVVVSCTALAAPPAGSDPSSPLGEWYRSLRMPDTGMSCCSEADCREVEWRPAGDHYEALIDQRTFGADAPGWVPVPSNRILVGRENPTGRAVVCWRGRVLCFVKASET